VIINRKWQFIVMFLCFGWWAVVVCRLSFLPRGDSIIRLQTEQFAVEEIGTGNYISASL